MNDPRSHDINKYKKLPDIAKGIDWHMKFKMHLFNFCKF